MVCVVFLGFRCGIRLRRGINDLDCHAATAIATRDRRLPLAMTKESKSIILALLSLRGVLSNVGDDVVGMPWQSR